jgi:hypothetical protein
MGMMRKCRIQFDGVSSRWQKSLGEEMFDPETSLSKEL